MNHFWYCVACKAQNSVVDGECQYCECGGVACKRDNCSDPKHFEPVDRFDERLLGANGPDAALPAGY
jgi:hypothetical protein